MRQVVVTGIGIIAPNGFDKETYWNNCNQGISFVTSDDEMKALKFKSHVLARIKNFNLTDHIKIEDYPGIEDLDPFVQFAISAAEQAIEDSQLNTFMDSLNKERTGIIFSSAIGGTPTVVKIFEQLTSAGGHDVNYETIGPRFYNSGMFNYPGTEIARKYGFSGITTSVTTGCSAGLDTLGICFDVIRANEADVMLAGASEAPLTALTYATLDVINSLATYCDEPAAASRPFDAKRSGFVISEGAVVLILEELQHALARQAPIYAVIKSFDSGGNAFHMTDLPADGLAMAAVIKKALQKSGLSLQSVEYINAHGSSTPQNDVFETAAYKQVFGAHAKNIPISSVKSMVGHSLASASLMGTVSVIGAIVNSTSGLGFR